MGAFAKLLKPFSIYRGLPRPVWALFFATVVNGAGIFVFPFLTLFLTRKLGMDERQAGNFMFFTSIAYLPGSLVGGKLADRFGRKAVASVAQILAAAAFVPCGWLILRGEGRAAFLVPAFVLLHVFFDGFSDPARQAVHTDLTNAENRQAAFSLNYLGHNLGFAIGPLIAGLLFRSAPAWLFWGNAIAMGAGVLVFLAFVPETKPTEEALQRSRGTDSAERAHDGDSLSALLARPALLAFVFLGSWYGLAYGQHRFSLPLLADATFGSAGPAFYGSLMSVNAICVIFLTAPTIAAFRRLPAAVNVGISGLLFAVGFGMLAFARSPALLYLSTVAWTLGEILNATNADVYVANRTPMSHRGRFSAILPFIGGFGWALSSPAGGAVLHASGQTILWVGTGAVSAAAAAGFFVLAALEGKARPAPGATARGGTL